MVLYMYVYQGNVDGESLLPMFVYVAGVCLSVWLWDEMGGGGDEKG